MLKIFIMIYLVISILCSVFVGILFKKIKLNFSESFFIISINYAFAAFLSFFLFKIEFSKLDLNLDFKILLPLIILMPSVFYALKLSINKSGIIKTDISQRISLIIPISASFLFFGENISFFKWIGIFLGFISVLLMLYKSESKVKSNSIFLALVFFGYGIIDVLFKQIAIQKTIPFTTYLFLIFIGCFFVSIIVSVIINKSKFKKVNFIYGLILGCLNFSNIYFYLKAHKLFSSEPSTVFAIMNFGVISLATILGVFLFNEKLSKKNITGIVLAIFAILFILLAQYKNI